MNVSPIDTTFSTEADYSLADISNSHNIMEISSVTEQLPPQLPSDPNDEYYLIHCFVCQEVAKLGQVNTPF